MTIRFECGNVIEDMVTGQLRACGQALEVDQAPGTRVVCPSCHQSVQVPTLADQHSVLAATSATADGLAEPAVQHQTSAPRRDRARTTSQPKASAIEELPSAPAQRTSQPARSAQPTAIRRFFDPQQQCVECGAWLDSEGVCTTCGYRQPRLKIDTRPIDQIPIELAGFQLWFSERMVGGHIKTLRTIARGLLGVVMGLLVVMAVAIGGGGAVLAVLLLIAVAGGYIVVESEAHRLATRPPARLNFVERPLWNIVWHIGQSTGWKVLLNSDPLVIDVRNQNLDDDRLLAIPRLAECQVLNLSENPITDRGLAMLHGLKLLRCLALRRTKVTAEGIFRIQQALPRVWIWY
jgi:hypothetical protein